MEKKRMPLFCPSCSEKIAPDQYPVIQGQFNGIEDNLFQESKIPTKQ
jgi:hypothetical protein